MKRLALLAILISVGSYVTVSADSDNEVKARKTALDLAGAFSNDGFKIRDGHWSGSVNAQEPALIAVNLYAGNQYWFAASADAEGKKLGVKVYDETGTPVTIEKYESGETAAAGFSPDNSG